jgi:hypothetical protein
MLLDHVPTVYFPKYVGIENKRLWFMQLLANVGVIIIVVGVLASNLFPSEASPEVRLSASADGIQALAGMDSSGLCSGNLGALHDYSFDESSYWKMTNTQCASWCSKNSSDISCIREADVSVNEAALELFVATSFTEELHVLSDDCPFDLEDDGECRKMGSYLIPGVEQTRARMHISYQIDLPQSNLHKYSGQELITTLETRTIILDTDGEIFKEFAAGEDLTLTVAEALQAAGFDGAGLDARSSISRASEMPSGTGAQSRPAARVTGIDIVVTAEIGNGGDGGDPTLTIRVAAVQTWSSRQVTSALDMYGSVRARTYNGVRFRFHTQGKFQWKVMFMMTYSACLAVAWMRIPFLLVFYFAVFMLGGLSDVYNGFLYQTLDFGKEFTGVCARMLKTSFSFADMHDMEEEDGEGEKEIQVWGISKERFAKRLETMFAGTILGNDKAKLGLFVDFVFERSKSQTGMPSEEDAILLEDYIRIFGSKEDLPWDDIVSIFDQSATQNTLEKLFMDSTLNQFYEAEMRIGHKEKTQYKVDKKKWNAEGLANKRVNAMQQLRTKRDLDQLKQQSNLVRAIYGQSLLEERMRTLELALRNIQQRRKLGVISGIMGEGDGDETEIVKYPRRETIQAI